jgi:adenylate kinase family enzyme
MQRILIVGSGGAGKSTLARILGAILGIEVIHLDTLFWKPGWIESEKAEWEATVRAAIARESWIMDGNFSGTLSERLEACDTVIFLDLPRTVCLWRILKRVRQYYGRVRPDLPEGCPERFDFEFMAWVWNFPARSRQKVLALLESHSHTKRVVRLRSRREVDEFVAQQFAA